MQSQFCQWLDMLVYRTSCSTISENLYRNGGEMGQLVQWFLIATGKA
jgi:hypothetical protein